MNRHNMPLPEMLEMIERYFDCLLTDEEESRLRSILATMTCSHPAIDEAKAVMGFLKPRREAVTSPAKSPRRWRPIASVAAAAVMLGLVTFIFLYRPIDTIEGHKCIAYVNEEVITDEAEVLKQLTADLREFNDYANEASLSFREEMDEALPLIEDNESDPIID